MTENQKKELVEFLNTSHTDDDLFDYIKDHKLKFRETYIIIADFNAPSYCSGCEYVLNRNFYPCNMCSRGKEDKYIKRKE